MKILTIQTMWIMWTTMWIIQQVSRICRMKKTLSILKVTLQVTLQVTLPTLIPTLPTLTLTYREMSKTPHLQLPI